MFSNNVKLVIHVARRFLKIKFKLTEYLESYYCIIVSKGLGKLFSFLLNCAHIPISRIKIK